MVLPDQVGALLHILRMRSKTLTDAARPDFEQNLVDFGSARFTRLRPGQGVVLDAYADQHLDTTDLAIEMPTGEGKTLLALLIADHALTCGWSVAYLTGTRQLAERVEEEAAGSGAGCGPLCREGLRRSEARRLPPGPGCRRDELLGLLQH